MSDMQQPEPVVQLAEAYVALEDAKIRCGEYAEQIRETLPPGYVWPPPA